MMKLISQFEFLGTHQSYGLKKNKSSPLKKIKQSVGEIGPMG